MNKSVESTPAPVVLIVEDLKGSLASKISLLEETGFKVVPAKSKEEALTQLRRGIEIDLVVTDINLDRQRPDDKSGLELAQQLRDFSTELPIIGYSAVFGEGQIDKDQLQVFQQYILKGSSRPVDILAYVQAWRQLALQYREFRTSVNAELNRLRLRYGISEDDLKALERLVSRQRTPDQHSELTHADYTSYGKGPQPQSQYHSTSVLVYITPEVLAPPLHGDDLSKYLELLSRARNAKYNIVKGLLLEELAQFLFSKTLCFEPKGPFRSATGQVDNFVLRKGVTGTFLDDWSRTIIVECKNWEVKINSKCVRDVTLNAKKTGSNVAVVFSRYGLTGNPGFDGLGEVRNTFLLEGIAILVIDDADLDIIANGGCLINLLRDKWLEVRRLP